MRVVTGTYTGDGVGGSSAVTGVGFQPKMVIVQGRTGDSFANWTKTDTHGGSNSVKSNTAAFVTDGVTSLDADGFSYGIDADDNTAIYHYICFGSDTAVIETGSYTGDDADDRNISTSLSSLSTVWMIKGTIPWRYRTDTSTTDSSAPSAWRAQAYNANGIQSFASGTFQVGTALNANPNVYHWVAFGNVTGQIDTVKYTGNGADARDITVDFQPLMMLIKSESSGTGVLKFNTLGDTTDLSWTPAGDLAVGAESADHIQAWDSDSFQVGTSLNVNADTIVFHAWAVRDAVAAVAAAATGPAGASAALSPFQFPTTPYAWYKMSLNMLETYRKIRIQ